MAPYHLTIAVPRIHAPKHPSPRQRGFATVSTPMAMMASASLKTKGVNLYVYDHCPFCVRGT